MYLAQYVNTPIYIVHVMSKGAASLIADAKLRGQRVIGETIASGIAAVEGKIWDPDFKVCIAVSEFTFNVCRHRRHLIEPSRVTIWRCCFSWLVVCHTCIHPSPLRRCLCEQEAAKYVMSPPIRSPEHQEGLKAAVAGGVLDIVATDHCPWNSTQKRAGIHDFRAIPNGVNGIEERMHITWDTLVKPGVLAIASGPV